MFVRGIGVCRERTVSRALSAETRAFTSISRAARLSHSRRGVIKDIQYGFRTLARNRIFSVLAIVTLGLGIGANTAIFSVISGVLLKPLPYTNGDRLVLVNESAPLIGRQTFGVSIKELYEYREQAADFDKLVEYHQMNFDLLNRGEPTRVNTGVVSHDFFNVLGIQPILGRTFLAEDDRPGADAVLVLSYSFWQQKFGGDPRIVGQVFQMNDRPHTVVGVLPNVPHYPQENDVYMSVSACPFRAAAEKTIDRNRRAFGGLIVFGHLKPDVSRARANGDIAAIAARFAKENPTVYRPGSGFTATTLSVQEEMTKDARLMLLILLGTTGLILLIACANVANLTLARLLRRDRELALRAAIGASRARLVRQLLVESTLLALAGGVFGLFFASWTVGMLTSFVGRFTARTGEIAIDPWVLAFTLGVSMLTGLLFGTFPALASRVDLVTAMKQSSKGTGDSRGRRALQKGLIVAQVAVSVVLLVGAGLLLASFYRLQRVDSGYRGDRVLSAEVFTNFSKYPNAKAQLGFYQPLLERLRGEPGVTSAAITNAVPLTALQPARFSFQIKGRAVDNPDRRPTADIRVASPDYFVTLGVPLIRGRLIAESDGADAPHVMVINNAMTRYFDMSDPIGSDVSFDNGATWATVVGIAGDVKQFGLDKDPSAQIYLPLAQSNLGNGRVLVRTAGDPLSAAKIIRDNVHAIDPNMPVENLRTLDDIRDRYLATPRLTAILLLIFAALAMLVTLTGITGVIATSVSQRTQEFGVRLALGASRDSVLRMVVGEGLTLVGAGLAIGVAASIALTRVLSTLLFETAPTDPLTFAGVIAAFSVAGLLACLGPAWRATTADPMQALRAD
jgi:putative ABC transport system permease protein